MIMTADPPAKVANSQAKAPQHGREHGHHKPLYTQEITPRRARRPVPC